MPKKPKSQQQRKQEFELMLDRILAPVRTVADAAERAAQHQRNVALADVIDRHSLGMSPTAFMSKETAKSVRKHLASPEMVKATQEARMRRQIGQTPVSRSASTLFNAPLGGVLGIRALALDSKRAAGGDFSFPETRKMGVGVYEGSKESLLHPLRDPAATILTFYGALSLGIGSVGKVAVASTLAKQGKYAAAAKALAKMPHPDKRVFKDPEGNEVRGYYSRNQVAQDLQRAHDFYIMKAAAANPGGKAAKYLNGRMAREQHKNNIVLAAVKHWEEAHGRKSDIDAPLPPDIATLIPDKFTGAKGAIAAWDTTANAIKMSLIYAKLGYIPPNLLGNIGLNLIQQGPWAGVNLVKAARISGKMTKKEGHQLDNLGGSGIAESIMQTGAQKGNRVTRAAHWTAEKVSVPTDRYTRRASILYEFDRMGYKGLTGMRTLMNNPKLRGDLVEAVRRARDNAIEYENLGAFEKSVLNRFVFIYPWIKGSTTFAGRMVRDHPVLSAIMYHQGAEGADFSKEFFGPKPSYEEGIIPGSLLGLGKKTVIDPRGVSMLGTLGDLETVGRAFTTGKVPASGQLSEMFAPQLQLLMGRALNVNPRTGTPLPTGQNILKYGWEAFVKETPQAKLLEAIKGTKPYPTSIMQRTQRENLLRQALGSVSPSTISKANLNRKGIEEAVSLLPSKKRLSYYVERDKNEFELALSKAGATEAFNKDGTLVAPLQKAWKNREQRKQATADLRHPPDGAPMSMQLDYQRKAFKAEFALAVKLGYRKQGQMDQAMKWAKTARKDNITGARGWLRDKIFKEERIGEARTWAREAHGAEF
jgi:hypothetical protein